MICFRRSLFLLTVFCALLSITACQSPEKIEVPREKQLIIGLQSGYPPFEFFDFNGKIVGFDVDVAHAIAKEMGRELVIKDINFEDEIFNLQKGEIDLIVSGMNIIPSRIADITMIPYYGETTSSLSLIFWDSVPEGIQSFEDIGKYPNAVVSVESGSIAENYIKKFPELHAKPFSGALAPFMDVKLKKSLANLVQNEVAMFHKEHETGVLILDVPLKPEDHIQSFGIGIKKENNSLAQQVEKIIQNLKASGEMKRLENKWFISKK